MTLPEERTSYRASISRADDEVLRQVFEKYASIKIDGQTYMTHHDFVRNYLGLFSQPSYNKEAVSLLGSTIDTNKNGMISFDEFQAFEGMLCAPDAMYALAFQLFDRDGSGTVSFKSFRNIIEKTAVNRHIPFDFESDFICKVFGKDQQRKLRYAEFTQILHDFHEVHATQAFHMYDVEGTGFISTLEFSDLMVSLKDHLLTPAVKSNLIRLGGLAQAYKVSYAYYTAFISLLNNMEMIKRIHLNASKGNLHKELTAEEFMAEAQMYTQITPLEITILYQIVDVLSQSG